MNIKYVCINVHITVASMSMERPSTNQLNPNFSGSKSEAVSHSPSFDQIGPSLRSGTETRATETQEVSAETQVETNPQNLNIYSKNIPV